MAMTTQRSIRELREQRNWTLAELGREAHVNERVLADLELGQVTTGFDALVRIATAFGVSIDTIRLPFHKRLLNVQDHYFLLAAFQTSDQGAKKWRAKVLAWDPSRARRRRVRVLDPAHPDMKSPSVILSSDAWAGNGATADEALTVLAKRLEEAMHRALFEGHLPGDASERS